MVNILMFTQILNLSNKKLVDKLLQASALINNKSSRGYGNYIVVNSTIASVLSKLRPKSIKDKIKRLFNE
jgi:hypothetical protein